MAAHNVDWKDIWNDVNAQLEEIGQDFTDPKFYALKHVVEILSSNAPQAMVEELRAQETRLMSLVDALASGYHSGFARSIQNYSQILQLFGDATQQVDGIKKSLADAHRQLAIQSRHLHQQWRKSMMLEAQQKLLADVQLVVDAPGRIQSALDVEDWPTAVSLLQEAAARLARDSLQRILALRKVRAEVAGACASVQAQLLQELHARIYCHATASPIGGTGGVLSGGGASSSSRPGSPRVRGGSSGGADLGSGKGSLLRRSRLAGADGAMMGRVASGAMARAAPSGVGGSALAAAAAGSSMPQFVLDALAERGEAAQGSRLASLRELVGCLVQLDGLDEAKAYLTLHARGEVRRMMRRAIEAWTASSEERAGGAAALAVAIGTPAPGGARGGEWSVSPAMHSAVGRLMKAVFDQCLQALANLGRLLQEMAESPAEGGSTPALVMLKQQHLQGQQRQHGQPPGGGGAGGGGSVGTPGAAADLAKVSVSSGAFSGLGGTAALERLRAMGVSGYARAEYDHVWQQMQEEVQLLVAELLHAQMRGPQASPVALGGAARSGGWLADFAELASSASVFGGGSGGAGAGGASAGAGAASVGAAGLSSGPSFAGGLPGSGVPGASGSGDAGGPGGGGSRLMFSLEVGGAWLDAPQLQRAAAAAAGGGGTGVGGAVAVVAAAAEVGSAAKEAHSYAPLLSRALAGHRGGPYFTPAVYGPVKRFVEDAIVVMRTSGPQQQGAGAGPPASPASPRRADTPDSGADGGDAGGTWLLASLDAYVMEAFLPQVWVDLRGRVTAMLEDPDAFRPGSHFSTAVQAPYAATGATGQAAGSGAAGGAGRARPARAIVPAALFAAQVVNEVMAWVKDIPCIGTSTLTGVVDAILGRVLEAFAASMMRALAGSRARRLVLRPDLGLVMAGAPDAPLLGDPMAFYVPRSQDTFDGATFLASLKATDKPVVVPGVHRPPLKVHGFGLEGEAATEEVLLMAMRERPASTEQIMAGHRTQALVVLAALSESLDYVADRIQQLAATGSFAAQGERHRHRHHHHHHHHGGGATAAGPGSATRHGSPPAAASPASAARGPSARSAGGTGALGAGTNLTETMAMTIDRYRSLAGACCRAIHLDLLLLSAHHLGQLAATSHVCEPDDVRQVHPAVSALTRAAGRAAEELAPYLGPSKVAYTLGCVAPAGARHLVWAAQEVSEMNALGAERLIRTLAVMQGPLVALGAPGGTPDAAGGAAGGGGAASGTGGAVGAGVVGGMAECLRAYERAKGYYTLITLPAEEVVRLAADKPLRYSVAEWEALLAVRVPGRPDSEQHMAALHRALDKTYNLSAGQKVTAALEEFGSRMQAPVASLADSITAGIKGGMLQARALLKQAAASTSAAVQQAGAVGGMLSPSAGDAEGREAGAGGSSGGK